MALSQALYSSFVYPPNHLIIHQQGLKQAQQTHYLQHINF